MKKICILALIACAFLAGCGNTDSTADDVIVTTTSEAVTTVETTTATSAAATQATTTATSAATTTAKTTKATTTTKSTTKKVTTTKKKTTTAAATAQATQQIVNTTQAPAPVYTQAQPQETQPVYTQAPTLQTTPAPKTTPAPQTTTAKPTTKAEEKPASSSDVPPNWPAGVTYDPQTGKGVTKQSVMKELGIDSKTYDAYEAMVRGISTKAQRLLVRDDVIQYTLKTISGSKLDDKIYAFEKPDGQPTCNTREAVTYGPCGFGEHGETSFFTMYWVGGLWTLPSATLQFAKDSRAGADHNIHKNGRFNVQVVYYGLDGNVGTLQETSVIVMGGNSDNQTNSFFEPTYATEQTYDVLDPNFI